MVIKQSTHDYLLFSHALLYLCVIACVCVCVCTCVYVCRHPQHMSIDTHNVCVYVCVYMCVSAHTMCVHVCRHAQCAYVCVSIDTHNVWCVCVCVDTHNDQRRRSHLLWLNTCGLLKATSTLNHWAISSVPRKHSLKSCTAAPLFYPEWVSARLQWSLKPQLDT